MVKPGGTGRPRFAISARPAPLPPRMSRIAAEPSARPGPKKYTQRARDGTSDHTVRADCRGAAWRAPSRTPGGSGGDPPGKQAGQKAPGAPAPAAAGTKAPNGREPRGAPPRSPGGCTHGLRPPTSSLL